MPILTILSAVFNSRLANILLAAVVGMGFGWWRTDASWRQWEKGQEAIRAYNHQVELAREAQNAVEIAKAATARVEDDEAELQKLRQQVEDFDKEAANAKNCPMDDRLIGAAERMRQPTPRGRRPALTRRPR